MVAKIFWVVAVLGAVTAEPPSTNYGTPLANSINNFAGYDGNAGNSYDHGHGGHGDHGDHGEPKAYEFGYQVKDEYSGNNYNRKEASDGNQVRGEYRVQLPDGRTQIVTYYADWQTGFHADVRYEGEAHYPEQYNTYQGGYQGQNTGGNNYNSGYNSGNNYDSYSAGYGNKGRPSYEYGAP
ncbi:pro-resilin [Tribolium castaneum]|nr:PREDICTED: pro-resilin [Tribolium castaneum]|eukprot:XP_966720.1 PREDICTED: pro-resilin [Tribolium castaneum]